MEADFDFKLVPAVREAVPPLISLWGPSGSGKTYSALLLARGIVGSKGTVCVIDTENGRAKFYSEVGGKWLHLDLQPPFTAEKYNAAFIYCEQHGANVIVVDSGSHVWEGEGGVLDQAESGTNAKGQPLKGLAKFNKPKMRHKRMMNRLTRSPIPVIFCLRAKDAVKEVRDGGEVKIVSIGWQPIAEKNFIYEMTVDLRMTRNGQYDLEASKSIPEGLRGVIKAGGQVNEEMGRKIADWMGGGAALDPEYLRLKRDGQDKAIQGVDCYKGWLDTLKPTEKELVRQHHKDWTAAAKLADEHESGPEQRSSRSALDDRFTPGAAEPAKAEA